MHNSLYEWQFHRALALLSNTIGIVALAFSYVTKIIIISAKKLAFGILTQMVVVSKLLYLYSRMVSLSGLSTSRAASNTCSGVTSHMAFIISSAVCVRL